MRAAIWTLAGLVLILTGYLMVVRLWPSGHGSLVVLSDPPGALIYLDLKPTGHVTNDALRLLPPGHHSILVRLDTLECDPIAHVVETRKGHTDTVFFRMVTSHEEHVAAQPVVSPVPEIPGMRETAAVEIPTGDSLRRASENRDTVGGKRTQRDLLDSLRHRLLTPAPLRTPGVLEIVSSVPGAKIFVNGTEQAQTAPTTLTLPEGTYVIRAALKSYVSEPGEQTVMVRPGEPEQSLFFNMSPEALPRLLRITTSPVPGKILVDNVPAGDGKTEVPEDYGTYSVSFGPVDGWKTPDPILVTITPNHPQPDVQGVYTKGFHAMAEAQAGGRALALGMKYSVGYFVEGEGAKPSASLGAKIRQVPNSQKFAWELAEGDANRNPTGQDYVDFTFTLPPDADPKAHYTLRLYVYRSNKRYALALSKQSELVVTVNNHTFLDGWRPPYEAEAAADAERYEEWPIGEGFLMTGENHIRVYSGESNTMVNYLCKIEIL